MHFVILRLYSDFLTVNLIGRDTRNYENFTRF